MLHCVSMIDLIIELNLLPLSPSGGQGGCKSQPFDHIVVFLTNPHPEAF